MEERIKLLRAMATLRRDVAYDQRKNRTLSRTLRKEASIIELCANILESDEEYNSYREIYENWLDPEGNENVHDKN